jgi:YggT family protein
MTISLQNALLVLAQLWAILCMARMLLQLGRLNYLHPLAQFCTNMTQWAVKPLRKIIPPIKRMDMAALTAAILGIYLAYTAHGLLGLTMGVDFSGKLLALNGLLTLVDASKAFAYTLLIGAVLRMFFSFTKPYAPIMVCLHRIFEPLSRPFKALRYKQFDFSASVVVLGAWIWVSAVVPSMTVALLRWYLSAA